MKIDKSLNNVIKYQFESALFAGEKINIELRFDKIVDTCATCCYRKICGYRIYFEVIDNMISTEINCDKYSRPIGYIFPANPLDFGYVEDEITDFLDNLIGCSGNDDYRINQLLVFFQVLYEDMNSIRRNEY